VVREGHVLEHQVGERIDRAATGTAVAVMTSPRFALGRENPRIPGATGAAGSSAQEPSSDSSLMGCEPTLPSAILTEESR
jgi:hypothetical protein